MSEMAQLIMKFVDAGGMRLIETMDRVTKAAGVTEKAVTTAQDKMAASDAKLAREAAKAAREAERAEQARTKAQERESLNRAKLALYEINEKNKYAKQDIEFFNRYLAEKDRRAAQAARAEQARATQESRQTASRQKSENDALLRDWLQAKDARTRSRREEASQERRDASARATQRRKDIADDIALGRKAIAEQKALAAQSVPSATGGTVQVGGVQGLGLTLSTLRQIYDVGQQAARVVADVVNEAAKWEKYKVALTDIEGSAGAAGRALDTLYELAKRPGIGLLEAQQVYLQFRALGIEGDKATRMIEAFSNAVALSGGGATEFQRINYQLVQMISKGKVLEEDLRIMRNSMPRLTVLMQQAFGATTAAGIREAGINAEGFVAGIVREMEKLPTATQTLESRIENAGTAWSRFKASLVDTDTAGMFVDLWTGALDTITEGTSAFSVRKIVKAFGTQGMGVDADRLRAASRVRGVNAVQSGAKLDLDYVTGANTGAMTSAAYQPRRENLAMAEGTVISEDEMAKAEEAAQKREAAAKKASDDAKRRQREAEQAARERVRQYEIENAEWIASGERALEDKKRQQDLALQLDRNATDKYYADQEKRKEADLRAAEKLREDQEGVRQANQTEYEALQAKYARERELIATMEGEKAELLRRSRARERRETLDFWTNNISVAAQGGASLFDNMAGLMANMQGEQSKAYKAMFAVSKGFAIADASVHLASAAIKALDSKWPESIAAVGTVMAAGGALIGQINATAYSGVFDKGGNLGRGEWGIAGENGPEIVEGPARITSTRDTARKGMGGMNVQVYNYAGAKVETKQNKDGSLAVIIREAVNATVNEMTASVATGRGDFNRALQTTFGLKRGG